METPHAGVLTYLVILWAGITISLIALFMYRSILSQRQEGQIFLDRAEDHIASEQRALVIRLEKFSKPLLVLGVASGVLLLAVAALWFWEGWKGF